jgi:hypothetical protein
MTDVANKFGDWIKEGFDIYKTNLGALMLPSLIAFLLSAITLGILSGPMGAGMVLIALKLRDGGASPAPGDVFQGFQFFLPSFLFCIVWGAIIFVACFILSFVPCLGQLLTICISLAAAAFLMFGLFLIVDQKMDFWTASMASIEKVKPDFFPLLGLAVVASILGQIGAIACVIGVFITMPLYFTILAVTYRDVFNTGAASASVQQPPVQEPPVEEAPAEEPPAEEPPAEEPTVEPPPPPETPEEPEEDPK